MPGSDPLLLATAVAFSLPPALGALLYGPAPGVEFIPQFLSLLAFVGLAFLAVLTAPITALLRRLRRGRGVPPAAPKDEPMTASVPEPSDEGSRDRA